MKCEGLVPRFTLLDLEAEEWLPKGWREEIEACTLDEGTEAVLSGGESTSLERPGTEIRYRLVTGDGIATRLPWLDALYRGPLLDYACAVAGTSMVVADSLIAGVNINVLDSEFGSRYEWHTDSNPLTCVVFVTSHDERSGGGLLFRVGPRECMHWPRSGTAAFFDAREAPHTVTAVAQGTRISIPMNFYVAGEPQERPKDLDQYLYGGVDRPIESSGTEDGEGSL